MRRLNQETFSAFEASDTCNSSACGRPAGCRICDTRGKRLDRCTGRSRSLAGQNRLDRDLNTGFQLPVKCIPKIGLLLRSRATERKFSRWKAIKLPRVVVGTDRSVRYDCCKRRSQKLFFVFMIRRPSGDEIAKLNWHRSVGVNGSSVDLRGALPGKITIRVAVDAPQEKVECGSV